MLSVKATQSISKATQPKRGPLPGTSRKCPDRPSCPVPHSPSMIFRQRQSLFDSNTQLISLEKVEKRLAGVLREINWRLSGVAAKQLAVEETRQQLADLSRLLQRVGVPATKSGSGVNLSRANAYAGWISDQAKQSRLSRKPSGPTVSSPDSRNTKGRGSSAYAPNAPLPNTKKTAI